eukprot:TRINITY_DN891_c0_g1_i1.p1 TRINITY_DN891_c0_g1~~TRINITY_DN891_c0_g1_i1.p1  ORF type:complete len:397 (+),score=113.11 TRINITY_DN891_c0_g1_i1:780-1970(+)
MSTSFADMMKYPKASSVDKASDSATDSPKLLERSMDFGQSPSPQPIFGQPSKPISPFGNGNLKETHFPIDINSPILTDRTSPTPLPSRPTFSSDSPFGRYQSSSSPVLTPTAEKSTPNRDTPVINSPISPVLGSAPPPTPFQIPAPPTPALSTPSEMKKCDAETIKGICKDYGVYTIARNHWELIGRMLLLFPDEVLTEEELDKFNMDNLQKMCDGAWISRIGDKEQLIDRLIHYGKTAKLRALLKGSKGKNGDEENGSHKRKRSDGDPEDAKARIKKRKLAVDEFIDLAPTIPVTIETSYYDLPPKKIGSTFGWAHKDRQILKVSGDNYLVEWELNIKVLRRDDEDPEPEQKEDQSQPQDKEESKPKRSKKESKKKNKEEKEKSKKKSKNPKSDY